MTQATPSAASPRVLEYAGPGSGLAAAYAGWLLGRLGARVARLGVSPDADARADCSSLKLGRLALAEGKTDLEWPEQPEALVEWLADTDLLLCDVQIDRLDPVLASLLGDRQALERRLPRLIVGFATIHGLEGPNAGLPSETLDAQALSATAWALGEAGREPLTLPAGVAEHQSGVMLAAACLLALTDRDRTGCGQIVDISLTEVLASQVAANSRVYVHHGLKWHRNGRRPYGSCGAYPFAILPCKDGEVCISGRTRDEWQRLVNAMGNPQWASEPRYQDLRAMGTRYPEEGDALLAPWLMRHTRAELEALALQHNLILAPLRRFDEVLATPQFAHRQFIGSVQVAGRSLLWPGLPFRMLAERTESAIDQAASMLAAGAGTSEAPRCGSADSAATGSIGAKRDVRPNVVAGLPAASKVPVSADPSRADTLPLSGLRVLDFGWVWSAPWVGTILCEMGAQVIKVEHGQRPDNMRLAGKVIRDGKVVDGPTREMSPMFHQINHGKLGITLNLKDSRAVDLARRLAAESDLVIENMSPGSMERAGLGFESLRQFNPRLVMLSMSAAGQFGPASSLRAYAPTMSAFAGLESLVGYAGEDPIGALNVAIGDPNASLHGLVAALAALRHVRSGGPGVYIDLSQVESLVSTLRPCLLEAQHQGRQPMPAGNAHPDIAPHGIYPAQGPDSWLSIAVASEPQWQALCRTAGGEPFATDPRYADQAGRRVHSRELDQDLSRWTRAQDRDALVERLRAAGVASSPVNPLEAIWTDPQLLARQAIAGIEIPFYGPDLVFRAPWRLSKLKPQIDRPGPRLGEHTESVLGGILNLSDDDIAALKADGVLA